MYEMDEFVPPLSYAPDGLYESDIDALIAECFSADQQAAPSTVAERIAAHRHLRRVTRQNIGTALRSIYVSTPVTDTDTDAAA